MTATADSPPKHDERRLRDLASRHGLAVMRSSSADRYHLVRREGNWTVLAEVTLEDIDQFLMDLHPRFGHWM
ncbi:MAG: hypothetical protein ACTHJJ_06325 [Intrasporangium sp.]|uniref:hypothetical protein n=1 Tax=Intrasporangium sp. TaxID=1925024 RepID=UPI003F7E5392